MKTKTKMTTASSSAAASTSSVSSIGPTTGIRTPAGTAAAPLIYWLLVLCGLVGLTMVRLDASAIADSIGSDGVGDIVIPVWIGSIAGVGIGQLLSWLRIRAWLPTVMSLAGFWFLPILYLVLHDQFGDGLSICALSFVPAAVCGYLSLTERGALAAFWYPAMLWMLVILDGPSSVAGLFNARATVPFAIGLAGLFVAFLRARETRRVAIWQAHGSVRIAPPLSRTVLAATPFRAASELAWTTFVGAGALVLTAWIAPQLWQKEKAKHTHTSTPTAAVLPNATALIDTSAPPEAPLCCPDREVERHRVKEYFAIRSSKEEREHTMRLLTCVQCRDGKRVAGSGYGEASYSSYGSGYGSGTGWNGPFNVYGSDGYNPYGYGYGYATGPSTNTTYATPSYVGPGMGDGTTTTTTGASPITPSTVTTTTTPALPTPALDPLAPTVATATTTTAPKVTTPKPATTAAATAKTTTPTTSTHAATTTTTATASPTTTPPPSRTSAPMDAGSPWKWTLALCGALLALRLFTRVVRRNLTLRHLARPFWAETLDQQISNHWQRMLIGLRDAGIHPIRDEQPQAFAKRVGGKDKDIMATCATILERVRHGVRVDGSDLETMDAAATTVYTNARRKAGASGRLMALLRWPLV